MSKQMKKENNPTKKDNKVQEELPEPTVNEVQKEEEVAEASSSVNKEVDSSSVVKEEEEKQGLENIIDKLERGQKPWYLSATEIYKFAKSSASNIPQRQVVVETAINGIDTLTKYVKESTTVEVDFKAQDAQDLIEKLDQLLSEQTVKADDGFDHIRSRLCRSLHDLMGAIIHHKKQVEDYTAQNQQHVQTRYENFMNVLHSLLNEAKTRYSDMKEKIEVGVDKVSKTVQEGKEKILGIDLTLYGNAMKLLHFAQPYVQDAYVKSSPLLNQAVVMSQPYIAQALPFVNPVVCKVTELNKIALEDKTVGPHMSKVYENLNRIMEETKIYVTPSTN